MKKTLFISMTQLLLYSCNMSDSVEELPQGYKAIYEGGNQNRLIKNNKLFIDSGMVDVKYNDTYLLVSVDTTYSMNPNSVNKRNLKYFIQDLKQDTILRSISYQKLQHIIEKEALSDLDITQ
ncbi:hypothetical protein HMPREF9700_00147 [Bergeyella zoohelcum CCUG 30536]|uniref:Uncharacterized protein n=2 Tax=Bergeyella zoohelcum TaxID=1015 RepID=A0A380ZT54_9FLAO|nr:hypothetical protein HMPREF9700_00147 [Bergeyella zoohelcum CCUG 30536]SUV52154.1 Uncharacterised protein [Bergeyella zoohelcum]